MKILYSALIASFIFCSFAFAQTEFADNGIAPIVVKAVAPNVYPAAALALKIEGEVKVKVKINRDGSVKSNEILSGHPLLRRISEITAVRWKFVPSSEEKERVAELSFIYRIAFDKRDEETSFNPPHQIIFIYNPPKIENLNTHDPPNIKKKN